VKNQFQIAQRPLLKNTVEINTTIKHDTNIKVLIYNTTIKILFTNWDVLLQTLIMWKDTLESEGILLEGSRRVANLRYTIASYCVREKIMNLQRVIVCILILFVTRRGRQI